MDQFVVDQQQAVFGNDALLSAQPLTSESNTPAEISAKFGTITYSKGTKIFRQFIINYRSIYYFLSLITVFLCYTELLIIFICSRIS